MRFRATVEPSGNATGIEVPAEIVTALAAGKRPKVGVRSVMGAEDFVHFGEQGGFGEGFSMRWTPGSRTPCAPRRPWV